MRFAARTLPWQVHREARVSGLAVKVFDCYRPTAAVAHFVRWSADAADQVMKPELFPNVDKADFFRLGYVAEKSGHSRGSTVDVTLVPEHVSPSQVYVPGGPLVSCTAPRDQRFRDNGIDFGTAFDCMDPLSHPASTEVGTIARHNRAMLAELMEKHGFKGIPEEWWHFTLRDEPFPGTWFDFPVQSPQAARR